MLVLGGPFAYYAFQYFGLSNYFYPHDFYSSSRRAALDAWLKRHGDGAPWMDPIRPNIVGERVFFLVMADETLICRVSGISMKQCSDALTTSTKAAGFERSDPFANPSLAVPPDNDAYSLEYDSKHTPDQIEVLHDNGSRDLILVYSHTLRASFNGPPVSPGPDYLALKNELGFDPFVNKHNLDCQKLAPPRPR